MAHVQELCRPIGRPLAANPSLLAPNPGLGLVQPREPFRVTRSTVSLKARDLMLMDNHQQIRALVKAVRAAGKLNREEMLIERLDDLPKKSGANDVAETVDALRQNILRCFKKLGRPEPRISLERWSFGYELRIYLTPQH